MKRPLVASFIFHLAFVGLLLLGLPRSSGLPPVEEPISVDIVGVATAPEIPDEPPTPDPAEAAPLPPRVAARPAPPPPPPPVAPRSEPTPEPVAELEFPEPEPIPEPVVAEPPPPAPPPEPEPVPAEAEPPPPPALPVARPVRPVQVAEPEPTPEPEPAEPEPPAPEVVARPDPPPTPPEAPAPETASTDETPADVTAEEDDFAALLRSVEEQARRVEAPERREGTGSADVERPVPAATEMAETVSLSASELAAIRRQIERCWNVPVGVPGIETMRVSLRIQLEADGSVRAVDIEDRSRFEEDIRFRTVAESARRAVLSCSLTLPAEKYVVWRDMVLTFSPGDALSG